MNKAAKFLSGLAFGMCLTLTVMTTTTTPVHAATTSFQDINQSFARQDIQALAARGVVSGYNDGTFQPTASITRAEFATMILKAKGFPIVDPYGGNFRDVQRGEWFTPYVELSYRLGVTSGTSSGLFQPNANLTREQMVKMTVAALGPASETARHMSYDTYSSILSPYVDHSQVDNWAKKEMAYAVRQGLLHGDDSQHLNPQAEATREEVAALIERAFPHSPVAPRNIGAGVNMSYQSVQGVLATAFGYTGNDGYTGLSEREGMVAVDPNVIPLGSHLYIPGYGYAVAADEGGAIKNKRVDLFMYNEAQMNNFGEQNVNVYVLD